MIDDINAEIRRLEAEREAIKAAEDAARAAAEAERLATATAELRGLVAAHNVAALELAARRAEIYDLVTSLPGHGLVRFASGEIWSNLPRPGGTNHRAWQIRRHELVTPGIIVEVQAAGASVTTPAPPALAGERIGSGEVSGYREPTTRG